MEPATLAQRQLDAYNAHDLDAFAACYAEDVEIRRLPGNDLVASGREALRRTYGELFAKSPGRRADLLARMTCGDFAVDHERVTDGGDGAPRFAVAIYEVGGGLIRRVWFPPVAEEGPA